MVAKPEFNEFKSGDVKIFDLKLGGEVKFYEQVDDRSDLCEIQILVPQGRPRRRAAWAFPGSSAAWASGVCEGVGDSDRRRCTPTPWQLCWAAGPRGPAGRTTCSALLRLGNRSRKHSWL